MHNQRLWVRLLLPCTLLAIGTAQFHLAATSAQQSERTGPQVLRFQVLPLTQALQISPSAVNLGTLTAGTTLARLPVLQVRNTSARSLALSAGVTGLPGLTAQLHRATLGPGESTWIELSGRPWDLGSQEGALLITALGDFLQHEIPLRATVVLPAPSQVPGSHPEAPGRWLRRVPGPVPAGPRPVPRNPTPAPADPIRPGGFRILPQPPETQVQSGRESE